MTTLEDYTKFLKQIRDETGIETLRPDESGLVSVRIDDAYNVNLQFVEATGDSGGSSGDEVPDLQAFRIHA